MTRVLIAGVSVRAAADSAARAGFDVTALDGYADRDQHPAVRALSLPRDAGMPFSAAAAAAAATTIEADAAMYLSNFENDPDAVATLRGGRHLWGNAPDVLRRARDPFLIARMFRAHGLPAPTLHDSIDANESNNSNDPNAQYLLKPFRSGGGHAIRAAEPGRSVRPGFYLQQRIDGISGSVVFVA